MFDSAFDQLLNRLHPEGREGRLIDRIKDLERKNTELMGYFHRKRRISCSNHAAFLTRNTFH